ncbi:NAD(P)H-dependent oxidoreductase [Arcobacter sp. CECT 8985]|uniref:NAD(P)H-dependent oxidoreductase n=1 Tax=Arcobacter sp. CECT 8985 TaxID=1935424 RepID=UPI00100C0F3F|nr:NAD(P)H-dependent oxidoreductase [Arcobacter sp. CECT 8985]RXJ86522.1 flavodoxin [Arcobacter sp. CECT 8985]
MKKILIINAHQKYEGFANGELTQNFIDKANKFFVDNGFKVKNTAIDKGYDVKEELEKFAWADFILFQYPVYWMSVPWLAKKYFDEVLSGGVGTVTYENDGRSRTDASKKYGSGGLMKGKKYMLSITYNCPESEFDNKDGFFEGLTLDQANFAVHKNFQFCGLEKLKTYSIHDVYKGDLDLEKELSKFETTLQENFK